MFRQIVRTFASTTFSKSKVVNVPADIFFKTVVNVPDYKNFVPLTEESEVVAKQGNQEFYGKLGVNFKVYNGSFISKVTHQFDEQTQTYKVVSLCRESKILKSLESIWSIKLLNDKSCDVDYRVEYEFSSILYQKAASMFMDTIAKGTLGAFEDRAKEAMKSPEIIASANSLIGEEKQQTEEKKETQEIVEDAPEEVEAVESYKDRKPGVISKMFKPRNAGKKKEKKVELDSEIVCRMTNLKNSSKLDDLAFYKLIDKYWNDPVMKGQIKNLYLLEKDKSLSEVHFVTYLKQLLQTE